ncbi:MAG: BCAM0308 family protein [Burkholderiales bacterium]
MNAMKIPPGFQPFRHDRVLLELLHDSYKMQGKLSEPTVCPTCGAVYHAGRWQWIHAPENSHRHICSACHRIQDQCPAGYVIIKGAFFAAHRDEILHLVQHQETREKAEHPMHRIMATENLEDGVLD